MQRFGYGLSVFVLLCITLVGAVAPQAAQAQEQRCFTETGFCIAGRIREFWEQNGGLAAFGYPITAQREEQIEGKTYQVQWFERVRLELHPENARPYDVLMGRLGAERLAQQGRDWRSFPTSAPEVRNDCQYFPQTAHFVCAGFLVAWYTRGIEMDGTARYSYAENLAFLGLPLSEAMNETIEGKTYQVQWFERGRIELHPENAPPYNLLGGLLGSEIIANRAPVNVPPPAGRIAYLAPDGVSVKSVRSDGSDAQTLFTISRQPDQEFVSLSADKSGTAFLYGLGSSRGIDYYLVRGTTARKVGTFASRPRWSPGNAAAFVAQGFASDGKAGPVYLYDVASDLNVELPIKGVADWFPDAGRLVYAAYPDNASAPPAANVYSYDIASRSSTRLTNLPTTERERWVILEAHVLPNGQQIIFYGGKAANLGASGNGMQWWWIPATGGDPQPYTGPGGNGISAYAASPDGAAIAYSQGRHISACASAASVHLRASDVQGSFAAEAPLPGVSMSNDSYAYIKGLSWEPNGNYVAFAFQPYRCANANGRETGSDALYLWKIRLINASGATLLKIADGAYPVWIP